MKRYYLLISLLLTCVFHSCKQTPKAQSLKLISTDEMIELMDIEEIQLVDVRTPAEFKQGHIPNAQNIDFLDENLNAHTFHSYGKQVCEEVLGKLVVTPLELETRKYEDIKDSKLDKFLKSKKIQKKIFIPNKLINILTD